jgi:hypothetical protein
MDTFSSAGAVAQRRDPLFPVARAVSSRHGGLRDSPSMPKAFADATAAMGQYEMRVRTMLQTHAESFEVELKHVESAFRSLSQILTDGASLLASELGRRG